MNIFYKNCGSVEPNSETHINMSTESSDKDIANCNSTHNNNNGIIQNDMCNSNSITKNNLLDNYNDKVPNYLNLACCVNGYSNLTTYDSKIRQDINKSREVSPIRPSTSSLQYCKQSNLLTPPTLLSLNEVVDNKNLLEAAAARIRNTEISNSNNNNNNNNNNHNYIKNSYTTEGGVDDNNQRCKLSFIQQRVELLYGTEALSQVFYSPNKGRKSTERAQSTEHETHELRNKYQNLSPTKAIKDNNLNGIQNGNQTPNLNNNYTFVDETDDTAAAAVDLPVFRHLNAQFRSQLPKLSPKRQIIASINNNNSSNNNKMDITNDNHTVVKSSNGADTGVACEGPQNGNSVSSSGSVRITTSNGTNKHDSNVDKDKEALGQIKDGHYFLIVLKSEQKRLLLLSEETEALTNELMKKEDMSEENLGILRSASGKAKLLVSQKMKQFEGLCKDNISPASGNKFKTTADDLQGFWDMVKLQVDHVDSLFEEINALKNNNWQKMPIKVEIKNTPNTKQLKTPGKSLSKGIDSKGNTPMSASALKREAQRKQLMEMKRKNKLAMEAEKVVIGDDNNLDKKSIEIFVNTSTST